MHWLLKLSFYFLTLINILGIPLCSYESIKSQETTKEEEEEKEIPPPSKPLKDEKNKEKEDDEIASRDRDRYNLYERNRDRSDWDVRTNWQYQQDDYFRGETERNPYGPGYDDWDRME